MSISLRLVLLASAGLAAFGAPSKPDCLARITEAYHTLAEATFPGQSRVLHLRFATETTYRLPGQSADRQSKTEGNMYVKGRQLYYETPDMLLWQDGETISSVLKRQRVVLLTRVPKNAANGSVQPLMLLRDSLIHSGRVEVCQQEQVKGKLQQHVRLVPAPGVQARFGMQALEFYLAENPTRVQRVAATYSPGRAARKVVMSFLTQEWQASSAVLTGNARSKVLGSNGQLLSAFKGYRLVDQTHIPSSSR